MSNFYKFIKNNSASILALTFSALTLFIYVRQTNILAEQTRASLWPYVQISYYRAIEGTFPNISAFYITVNNSGTGPAIVERVVMKVNGIEVENWFDFTKKVSAPFESFNISITGLWDKVIMPGETIKIVDFSNDFELMNYLYSEHFDNLEIAICYKSVYDEYWTVVAKGFGGKHHDIERHNKSKKCTLNATV
jgi:hypothetical protein